MLHLHRMNKRAFGCAREKRNVAMLRLCRMSMAALVKGGVLRC